MPLGSLWQRRQQQQHICPHFADMMVAKKEAWRKENDVQFIAKNQNFEGITTLLGAFMSKDRGAVHLQLVVLSFQFRHHQVMAKIQGEEFLIA